MTVYLYFPSLCFILIAWRSDTY